MKHVWDVQMVEYASTYDYIKPPVLCDAYVSNIILDQFKVPQVKNLLHEAGLLKICLPCFNADYLCAPESQFNTIEALATG